MALISREQKKKLETLKRKLKKRHHQKIAMAEPAKCSLHNCKLVDGKIMLHFGEPNLSPEYINARAEYFPNSNFIMYGGPDFQVVDENTGEETVIPAEVLVQYCEKCRETEENWLKQNSAFN